MLHIKLYICHEGCRIKNVSCGSRKRQTTTAYSLVVKSFTISIATKIYTILKKANKNIKKNGKDPGS